MDALPEMTEELEKGVESSDVYKGETIEDLATVAGIDADALRLTLGLQ